LRFTSQGTAVEALGEGSFRDREGFPASIAAVAVDKRTGEIYAASDTEQLIRGFGREGRGRGADPPPGGLGEESFCATPRRLTPLPDGRLRLPDDNRSRLWVFDPAAQAWQTFGDWGQGPAEFHMPVAASAGRGGELYVADMLNRRVVRFDAHLQYQDEIRYQPYSPWDIAAAPDGGCVVGYEGAIARYDGRGRMLWTWQAPEKQLPIGMGYGSGGAHREGGLAVAPDGTVYLTARLSDGDPNVPSYMLMVIGERSPREAAAPRLRVVAERSRESFHVPCGTRSLEVSTV